MSDIVQDIINAKDHIRGPWNWEPKHPQVIEGYIYLTQAQWDAVLAAFPISEESPFYTPNRAMLAWGIPVKLLSPGQHVTRPDGSVLCVTSWGEMYDIKHIDPVHVSYQPLSLAPHSYAYKPIVDVELPGDDESDPSRVHEY